MVSRLFSDWSCGHQLTIQAAVHYTIWTSYSPLLKALPLSLSHLSYGMPKEEGHDNSQIGSGDENNAIPQTSQSQPTSSPAPETRSRANTNPADLGFNLVGFTVPLPEPVRGVKNEAQAVLKKIDKGLGGTRLAIDTDVSAYSPPKETLATATVPGPPVMSTGDEDEEDNNDIEMRERQQQNQMDIEKGAGSTSIDDDNPFFAVPGGPGIRARDLGREGDPNAFFHPASKDKQRVIWLPEDELGLCKAEVQKNRELGIETSSRHAWLVKDGKVRVSGRPPGDD